MMNKMTAMIAKRSLTPTFALVALTALAFAGNTTAAEFALSPRLAHFRDSIRVISTVAPDLAERRATSGTPRLNANKAVTVSGVTEDSVDRRLLAISPRAKASFPGLHERVKERGDKATKP